MILNGEEILKGLYDGGGGNVRMVFTSIIPFSLMALNIIYMLMILKFIFPV